MCKVSLRPSPGQGGRETVARIAATQPHQIVMNQAGADAEVLDVLPTVVRRGVGVHDGNLAERGAEQVRQFFAGIALERHGLGGVTGAG